MIYAIVTTYTDGRRKTEYINQKAVIANKENTCLIGFIWEGVLHIEYVAEIHRENKAHPLEKKVIKINIKSAKSVQLFNTSSSGNVLVLDSLINTLYM